MSNLRKLKSSPFETKCTAKEFEDFYLSNPGATVDELANALNIGRRNVYYKKMAFDKKHKELIDPRLSRMTVEAYRLGHSEGYESGMLAGSIIGGLVLDMLKSQNMGISDLIAGLANKGATVQQQEQPVTEQPAAPTPTAADDNFYIYG